ncbi:MAG: phosphoenolpyruvate carboxykinase (GTP), partial [Candidatus Omnitrophica bacterium]|nr:phosphoenolpyruvate carboxykinase (GTP) [Candidatus Omnitrophota bacterium]
MNKNYLDFLNQRIDQKNLAKLTSLESLELLEFIGEAVELCNPASVFVRTDSVQDADYIKAKTLELAEEKELNIPGQTVHFDGPLDQGRDKEVTRYLVGKDPSISYYVNSIERKQGLEEIHSIMKDIMAGKEMFISFFCLGPLDSEFSILAVQITDSSYVVHSEDILYRQGYEQFKKNKNLKNFFKFLHSAGELENQVSKNSSKKRIYIDLERELVYSANTQYAGNTVGLKKLALRLAIQRASREDWLAEHMFLMGVNDLEGKKAYFAGAYPSMCGKTSTAMISGETIVGDDLAYLRQNCGQVLAVNVERGIFGIIKDVNPKDDPLLF